jgi:hypothetical protein
MPKIEKKTMKNVKVNRNLSRNKMYSSSLISFIIAFSMLIISLVLNAEYILMDLGDSVGENLLEDLIKSGLLIIFFFFTLISLGNYFELNGKVMAIPHIIALCILTLILASKDGSTFILCFFGIAAVLIYFYFLQNKVK